ncbi:MAG: anti-sigma-factor antagonist [Acidimicrobiales bacterium]|nr:anti-sigma-factor antagonist [Acidimicrobiales bacterium]
MTAEPLGLDIDVLADTQVALVRLVGSLDPATSGTLVDEADRLVAQGHRHLIIDCHGVTFCDSYGLRALLILSRRVRPEGTVTLARPSPVLFRLLELVGLLEHFEVAGGRRARDQAPARFVDGGGEIGEPP